MAADFREQLERRLLPSNRLHRFVRGLEGQGDHGTAKRVIWSNTFSINDWYRVQAVVRGPMALGTVAVAIEVVCSVPKPSGSEISAITFHHETHHEAASIHQGALQVDTFQQSFNVTFFRPLILFLIEKKLSIVKISQGNERLLITTGNR